MTNYKRENGDLTTDSRVPIFLSRQQRTITRSKENPK